MDSNSLHTICYNALLDLATGEGINASGASEIFGCVFGRDTAITVLKILKVLERNPTTVDVTRLKEISKRALLGLISLQGKEFNLESGEEPGKFIHEYRKDNFAHLANWFVYPDGKLRNYDSIDSTPLALIAIHKYWSLTQDDEFLKQVKLSVDYGLHWILNYGDRDGDSLLEYELSPNRKSGGLCVQSWTDSRESLRKADGSMPVYPIAPVEVQGYAWLALKLWGKDEAAAKLKQTFNEKFLAVDNNLIFPVQALDGHKNQITTVTGNPLLLLWASCGHESILEEKYVADLVKRAFLPDLFDITAGIRTMSAFSPTFNPNQDSYHNGSFWPILNGLVHEGLANWGYLDEANSLKAASISGLNFFKTPIELYIKGTDGNYYEYKNESGQTSCKQQAWSAAAALDFLTE